MLGNFSGSKTQIKLLTGADRKDHITTTTALLQQLHWQFINFKAQFKVLVLIYKALISLDPSYLKDCISFYDPVQELRPSREVFLSVLPPSQVHLVETLG